ncbi:hypothetical protein F4818DRAFT_422701 [Hypoxylon cercidicola]|nr:hypothetical protein F4818DRAFT_422701 [Hypoxylon cercidicola]
MGINAMRMSMKPPLFFQFLLFYASRCLLRSYEMRRNICEYLPRFASDDEFSGPSSGFRVLESLVIPAHSRHNL